MQIRLIIISFRLPLKDTHADLAVDIVYTYIFKSMDKNKMLCSYILESNQIHSLNVGVSKESDTKTFLEEIKTRSSGHRNPRHV